MPIARIKPTIERLLIDIEKMLISINVMRIQIGIDSEIIKVAFMFLRKRKIIRAARRTPSYADL